MKNKNFPTPEVAFTSMVDDIKYVFSGYKASWRQYLAVALASLFAAFVIAAGWEIFSPASQAAVPSMNSVGASTDFVLPSFEDLNSQDVESILLGELELEDGTTMKSIQADDEKLLEETKLELNKLLDTDLQKVDSQYSDLLNNLEEEYGPVDQTTEEFDSDTVSAELEDEAQTELVAPVEATPAKKANFFVRTWSGIVNWFKKVFKISLAASPVYAAATQDDQQACSASESVSALNNKMVEVNSRLKQLRAAWTQSAPADRESIKNNIEELRSLATTLAKMHGEAGTAVAGCIQARQEILVKKQALKDEAEKIKNEWQADSELSNWMKEKDVSLDITSGGEILAQKQKPLLSSESANPFSLNSLDSNDLEILNRALSEVNSETATARPDDEFETRSASQSKLVPTVPASRGVNTAPGSTSSPAVVSPDPEETSVPAAPVPAPTLTPAYYSPSVLPWYSAGSVTP